MNKAHYQNANPSASSVPHRQEVYDFIWYFMLSKRSLTKRSSGRGPRPHKDRGLRAAPPLLPRPLNAGVRRQR